MSMIRSLTASIAGAFALIAFSTVPAAAGVLPPIAVGEPMSMALLGAGVGALYLVKKLRG